MKKTTHTYALVHPHQFLESVAIDCMGKKSIDCHQCYPSEKKSLAARVEAQQKIQRLLIEYLTHTREDRIGLRTLFKVNEVTLRRLHACELYPTRSISGLSNTYFHHILIPFLMMRLACRARKHQNGLLFHLNEMLYISGDKYPGNIKKYMRKCVKEWQIENGNKHKPVSWIRNIRSNSYPGIGSYKLSMSDWSESQSFADNNSVGEKIECLYMSGLLFNAIKDIVGGFKDIGFYMECMLSLEGQKKNYSTAYYLMKEAVGHQDPASFLSVRRSRVGKSNATRELICFSDFLFLPYVLQEQFKSDLTTPKRLPRLNNLFRKLNFDDEIKIKYINELDGLGYVLRTLFSATILLEEEVDWIKSDIFKLPLDLLRIEIESMAINRSTEREIVRVLTQIISEVVSRRHGGESINFLAVFLYCFRYSEEITQPHILSATEIMFWDSFGKEYSYDCYEYIIIAAYNEFIKVYSTPDIALGLICNPLDRLEDRLDEYFSLSNEIGTYHALNKVFRKDRTIVRVGSKYPYQALRDIEQDICRLALTPYMSELLPNIKAYCELCEEEKENIVSILS